MAAERKGQQTRAKALLAKVSDPSLLGYAEARGLLSTKRVKVAAAGGLAEGQSRTGDRRPRLSPGGGAFHPKGPPQPQDHQSRGGDQYSRPDQRGKPHRRL